jgi:hypothetical protein
MRSVPRRQTLTPMGNEAYPKYNVIYKNLQYENKYSVDFRDFVTAEMRNARGSKSESAKWGRYLVLSDVGKEAC